jgi:alpha-glucosidase
VSDFDWLETLFHAVTEDYVTPYPPRVGNNIKLQLRVRRPHDVGEIYVRCAPEGSGRFWSLKCVSRDDAFDYYAIEFPLHWQRFAYRFFVVTSAGTQMWYNAREICAHEPNDHNNFVVIADHDMPDWLDDRVFYQIFPDRFCNGNSARNYADGTRAVTGETIKVKAWGDAPEGGFDFFNGDLEGILQNVDHFTRLGVNALYLTPIFLAPSNHKYDIQDYYQIDPHVGDDAVFQALTDALHQRDIRIVLDGIFNHCGAAHRWFNRYQAFADVGAYNSVDSLYADYFVFYEHPHRYEGWWGHESLPKLNYRSQALREAIYRRDDSVIQYWLQAPRNIDGWRFDVANMTARQGTYQAGTEVWREVRAAVKAQFPSAYLLGEHFYDGTELLQGDALDGNMNYMGFYYPILHWMSQKFDFGADGQRKTIPCRGYNGIHFHRQLLDFISIVPWQHARANYNMLNSHDRPRMITLLQGDQARMRTALIFLFGYVGVPAIYYGDEIGMEGGADPDCRRCMVWDERQWPADLFEFYGRLIDLRKANRALQRGSLQWLVVAENVVVFARQLGNSITLIVLVYASDDVVLPIPLTRLGLSDKTLWQDVLQGKNYVGCDDVLSVPSESAVYTLSAKKDGIA